MLLRLCEELLNENDFETVSATLCCFDYCLKPSEAAQKTAADEKMITNTICVLYFPK